MTTAAENLVAGHLGGSVADVMLRPTRLAEITRLGLASIEPGTDPVLRAAVENAARVLAAPVAIISVVMDEAQGYLATHGLEGWALAAQGTPIEWSFCRFTVADHAPFVFEDATSHARVQHNPLVQIDGVRSYAGVPLITSRGEAVGSLCVLGTDARTFSPEQVAALQRTADDVMGHLERCAEDAAQPR